MQQRMRGAGRHEVADDSFGFILPVTETSPESPPTFSPIRSEPNTSAKRRRLNNEPGSATSQHSSASTATRSSTRLNSGQKPNQIQAIGQDGTRRSTSQSPPTTTKRIAAHLSTLNLSQDGSLRDGVNNGPQLGLLPAAESVTREIEMSEDLEDQQEPTLRPNSRGSQRSDASRLSNQSMMDVVDSVLEEVTESPVAAPGSGRRRRIEPTEDALTRSTRLQRVVMAEEEAGFTGELATSSPLARKARQSTATVGTLSTRTTRASVRKMLSSPIEALHGSSPLARHPRKSDSIAAPDSARSTRSQARHSALSNVTPSAELSSPPDAAGTSSARKPRSERKTSRTIPESPYEIGESEEENLPVEVDAEVEVEADNEEAEEAEEVDDYEAARQIGRKRPRVSPRQKPSRDDTGDVESPAASIKQPAKKRQPRHTKVSPAKQAQPRAPKAKKKPPARRKSDGESIPVTVQRYTKPLRRNDGDADEDILNADIPFTDHKSPNVIDVVLQMCEESMDKYLSTLQEEASQADGSASRKVFRTKLRTVEAFQEELRTQLQTQTIALDNLRTLKKRVRAAQKEKVSLRNEILRIRAEREQVSLKIDAVRMRHEAANKESLHQLGLSSTMDDVELAIENGKMAPELGPKEQRMAELANLDLLISQITNQVSTAGDAGGALRQIKDFNMFLERAAIALEGR